jgi:plasmid stabilization system protein ParE
MSGYAFHPAAFADLDEIWEYIAQDNIDAADRVLAGIHTVLRALAASPHIGHRRPDLTARPLRFHVARDQYLIAYATRREAAVGDRECAKRRPFVQGPKVGVPNRYCTLYAGPRGAAGGVAALATHALHCRCGCRVGRRAGRSPQQRSHVARPHDRHRPPLFTANSLPQIWHRHAPIWPCDGTREV